LAGNLGELASILRIALKGIKRVQQTDQVAARRSQSCASRNVGDGNYLNGAVDAYFLERGLCERVFHFRNFLDGFRDRILHADEIIYRGSVHRKEHVFVDSGRKNETAEMGVIRRKVRSPSAQGKTERSARQNHRVIIAQRMIERHLTLVLPAYNEAHKIRADLKHWTEFLTRQPFTSEIRIVDDGSSDDTAEVAQAWIDEWRDEKVALHLERVTPNRGKGYALKRGAADSKGKFLVFVDVGGCVEPETIFRALACLESHDVALASRRHHDSKFLAKAAGYRRFGSWAFRQVVRTAFGIRFEDTQCGFKAYRGDTGRDLFSRLKTDGFMFDLELLVRAKQEHLSIGEFGVEWKTDPDSRYRVFRGTLRNLMELSRIWIACRIG